MYTIFIVEDDRGIAEAIQTQARMWDMNVVISQNFRDVLSDFTKASPQLVVLDISLPFRDGYYWCEEIRKIS